MPAGSGFVNLSQNVPTTIRDGLRIGWNQKARPANIVGTNVRLMIANAAQSAVITAWIAEGN